MNFPLEYLELYVDDSQVELAESLISNGSFMNLLKVENNLYSAYFKLDKEYETEIKLVNNKVSKCSCECDEFTDALLCPHVVATLIKLRAYKSEEKTKKETSKKDYSRRVNTSLILKNVSHEDLIKFVKEYAKKSRNFSLDLKIRFASILPGMENTNSYVQILGSAISMFKNKDGIINSRGIKQIDKVCDELISQAEDQVALKRFTEAFPILRAILFKIPPLIKFDIDNQLIDIYKTVFELLASILENDISPEFKHDIFSFLQEDMPLVSVFNFNLENQYFDALMKLAVSLSKTDEVFELIEHWQSGIKLSKQNEVNILVLKISLYEKEGKLEEAQRLIEENLANPSILFIAVEEARKNNDWNKIKKISLASLNKMLSKENKPLIHDLLYEASVHLGEDSEASKYANIRFLESFDFKYVEKLVEGKSKSEKNEGYRILIDKLENIPYSKSKRNAIAELYIKLGDSKSLFEYILDLSSLELMEKYDELLIVKHKKKVYSTYKKLVFEYLKNHLGRVPAQKVSALIMHLKKIGAHDLTYDLTKMLKDEYSERHSLMEEIQFL